VVRRGKDARARRAAFTYAMGASRNCHTRSLRCALLDPSAAREARSSRAGSGTPTGARAAQEPSVRRQRVTLSVSPSTPRALFLAVSALMMAAHGGR
jgi:hypothetical protein